jgi:hypothetical protein
MRSVGFVREAARAEQSGVDPKQPDQACQCNPPKSEFPILHFLCISMMTFFMPTTSRPRGIAQR